MTVFRNNVTIDGTIYGKYIAQIRGLGAAGEPKKAKAAPAGKAGPSAIPGGVIPDPAAAQRLMGFDVEKALGSPRERYEKTVSSSALEYENKVLAILMTINSWRTGQAVIRAFGSQTRNLQIIPWIGGGSTDSPNASAGAEDYEAATARNRLQRGNDGEALRPLRRGTGTGSDVTVKYLPYIFARNVKGADEGAEESKAPPGTLQDEALLHEIVHALEQMSGGLVRRRIPFQPGYSDWGEWFAILIANIYRSERGLPSLRRHHVGFKAYESTTGEFLRTAMNPTHLRQFRRRYPMLFTEIRAVEAEFNPVKLMRDV
jgi:hypothetical protein